ncbi:hypothetical protein HUU53_01525 [Candidatus Micrarchaeota archaeon]|nr:hypothetical protein [Candidatus Micrarchaeota archaeon]
MTEEKNDKRIRKEWILLGVLALIVFVGAVFFFTSNKTCESDLEGLKIISCNPAKEFGDILKRDSEFDFTRYNSTSFKGVIVQLDLVAENSSINSIIGAVGAEVTGSLVVNGRNATAIGVVDENVIEFDSVPLSERNSLIEKSAFVIRNGDCDCLKTENDKIVFEGSTDFMLQHLLKMRGIIGLVLNRN